MQSVNGGELNQHYSVNDAEGLLTSSAGVWQSQTKTYPFKTTQFGILEGLGEDPKTLKDRKLKAWIQ